ncbi:MAG: DUF494 family protein [Gammaproteobacteria bacterium]
MSNDVLNVLMYFFERIENDSPLNMADPAMLSQLRQQGMLNDKLEQLMSCMNVVRPSGIQQIENYPLQPISGARVFSPLECARLSKKCRGILLKFEKMGVLTPLNRELVIDSLLQHPDPITIAALKWAVLHILSCDEDQNASFQMERFLLSEEDMECVH